MKPTCSDPAVIESSFIVVIEEVEKAVEEFQEEVQKFSATKIFTRDFRLVGVKNIENALNAKSQVFSNLILYRRH